MITSSEIELPRSPSGLRDFVEQYKREIQADTHERHLAIKKVGLHKQILEELIPLGCFAKLRYDDSYTVHVVLGNQGYDAEVYDKAGEVVDYIEITIPHNGKAKADDAKLVVGRGYGQTHVGEQGDDFEALFPHVLSTCRDKALKDYGGCTLVVAIEPMPPFDPFDARYEQKIKALVCKIAQIKFKAKKVFLLVLPDRVFDVDTIANTLFNQADVP